MFQWNPEDYAQNSAAQLSWARELINRLHLTGNEAILDVGCGDGKITAEISKALPDGFILGIDSSPAMIKYAQTTFPETQFPSLKFACMEAEKIRLEQQFDIVFSNAALHWVKNHQAFLQGVYQILRKGGKLLISCGGKNNIDQIQAIINQVIKKPHWEKYFTNFVEPWHFYDISDYEPWLKQAGFTIIKLELVPKDAIHTGAEGLAGWIRTTGMPYTHLIPEENRETFIKDVVETYLQKYPLDQQGNSKVKMVRLEVEAIKK